MQRICCGFSGVLCTRLVESREILGYLWDSGDGFAYLRSGRRVSFGEKKKEMDTLCLVRARRAKNDRRLGTGKTSSSAVRLVIEASFLLQCVLHLKKL